MNWTGYWVGLRQRIFQKWGFNMILEQFEHPVHVETVVLMTKPL